MKKKSFTLLKGFEEHPSLNISGSIRAQVLSEANLNLSAEEKLNLVLKLGDIEKNEICWTELQGELKDNPVNRLHPLYLRARQHPHTALCVVIGAICTKGDGSMEQDMSAKFSTDDRLKSSVISAEVEAKASVEKKSLYSFTIPPNTVLAYSCVEISISTCGGLISLHCTYDTFDDQHNASPFQDGNIDFKDGGESSEVDLIPAVHCELKPLVQCENFNEIRKEIEKLFRESSSLGSEKGDKNDIFYLLHILFRHALRYYRKSSSDNFVPLSTLGIYLDQDRQKLPWQSLTSLVGFTIPEDNDNAHAFIVFPSNKNEVVLIKTCLAMFDSILDISDEIKGVLGQLTLDQMKILIKVIELTLNSKNIVLIELVDETQLTDLILKSVFERIGYKLTEDKKSLTYGEVENPVLLNIYILLYTLTYQKDEN